MTKLKIREPIWWNKSIGIATYRDTDDLEITISFTDKFGNKKFPGKYYITKEKLKTYPTQPCKKIRVYIVPIEDLSRNG